jgi:uncharacterized membrane protein
MYNIQCHKKSLYQFIIAIFITIAGLLPFATHAQEIIQDLQGVWRAKVVEIVSEKTELIAGTETEHTIQHVKVEILEGEKKGEVVEFENDYITLKEGEVFFMNYLIIESGHEIYSVRDADRLGELLFFVLLFVLAIIAFGGKQGVRSLVSLAGTFVIIAYVLLPLLLKGYSPIVVSAVVAAIVLASVIYLTHGINRESHSAFLGTVSAVIVSSILAYIAIVVCKLTGFSSEESVYLNLYTHGSLNFSGLLLGGIIIGALGVLDDISITQAAVVRELYHAGSNLTKKEIFTKALRVGREHVGALVNTLALAYAGASLPLMLLLSMSEMSLSVVINQEMFATEIIRTIVGSIGLILAVPFTTFLAVLFLKNSPKTDNHHHSHSHAHHH